MIRRLHWIAMVFFGICMACRIHAEVLVVPESYPSIQEAVLAAHDQDTVWIRPGVYFESISVPSREITLAGNYAFSGDTSDVAQCVIIPPRDLQNARCLEAVGSYPPVPLWVVGLTFRGGVFFSSEQRGGITVIDRRLTVDHCHIDSCYWYRGAGIEAFSSVVVVRDSRITNFGAYRFGSALYLDHVEAVVLRSALVRNFSTWPISQDVIRVLISQVRLDSCEIRAIGAGSSGGDYVFNVDYASGPIEVIRTRISLCRLHHFFDDIEGLTEIHFDSNRVDSNQIQEDLFNSSLVDSGAVAFFRRNIFVDNTGFPNAGGKMFFTLGGPNRRFEVIGNLFLRNHNRENSVMCIIGTEFTDIQIERNYILENSCDAIANPPGGSVVLIATQSDDFKNNILMGNRGFAVFKGLVSNPPGYAIHNYWGHPSGPYDSVGNPLGQGDTVEFRIVYDPWEPDTAFMDTTESVREPSSIPIDFVIGYAFPNPFNAQVTIEFAVTRALPVRVEIFDLLGRQVATLADDVRELGIHRVTWNASDQSSGLYFARLSSPLSPNTMQVKKLVLLK